ncbi:M48 family metallopeptidase [Bacillus sp. DJP31]|uniref:M48 family metallopeptidase n=1 Tax=Bacillus sp. DJP31 TaxID=3409789 RepID=UPI003BB62B84
MKSSLQYGTKTIEYIVTYRERKTLEISVEPPNIVSVVAPTGTTDEKVSAYVKKKADWIVQKIFLFKDMEYRKIHRQLVNGESLLYLGRNYTLQLIDDFSLKKPIVSLFQGKFYIKTPTRDVQLLQKVMVDWYKQKALQRITERSNYYQHYFKRKPTAVKVKEQQKRWGSCTTNNELLFNWRSIMAPSYILDYIIVHEMCHLYYMNHSQEFWDLLNTIMPDYEQRKEWLKNNGVKLDL